MRLHANSSASTIAQKATEIAVVGTTITATSLPNAMGAGTRHPPPPLFPFHARRPDLVAPVNRPLVLDVVHFGSYRDVDK